MIIRGDASEAVAAVNSVMGALEKFAGGSVSAIGAALSKAFDIANAAREAAGAVGILGGVFEAVGVKAAATFESALARIQGLALNSKTAAQDIGTVRDQLLDLATKVPAPLSQLSDAYYHLVSAGVQVSDAEFVLQRSAMAAAAGHADLTPVLNTVVGAMNAYNVNLKDSAQTQAEAVHFTDVMTKSVQLGNVEFGAMAGAIGRVLPMAHALGLSVESAAADMSVLTHAGLNADEAATQLSAVMSQLIQQPKQGRTELALLNTSYDELLQIMARTPEEARAAGTEFFGLTGAFKFLEEHLQAGTNSTEEYDAALHHVFPNVRALRDYLTSWKSQGIKFEDIYGNIRDSAGVVDTAFALVQNTLKYWLAQIKNDLNEVLILFGAPMLAPIEAGARKVAEILTTIIDTLKAHPDWAAEAAQILTLASAFGVMAGGVATLQGALTLVGTSFGGVFFGMRQLTDGLFTILEPIGLVGAALLAFHEAWDHNWFGIRDTLKSMGFKPLLDDITGAMAAVGNAADLAIHGKFTEAWQAAQTAFGKFVKQLQSGDLDNFVKNIGPKLGAMGDDIVHGLGDALGKALPLLGDMASRLVTALAQGIADHAPQVLDGVTHLVDQMLQYIDAHAPQIGEGIGRAIGEAGTYLAGGAAVLLDKLGSWLLGNVGTLLDIGRKLAEGLIDGIVTGIESNLTKAVSALGDGFKQFLGVLAFIPAAIAAITLAMQAFTTGTITAGTGLLAMTTYVGAAAAALLILSGSSKDLAHGLEILGASVAGAFLAMKIEAFVGNIQQALQIVGELRQGLVDLSVARFEMEAISGTGAGLARTFGEVGLQATVAEQGISKMAAGGLASGLMSLVNPVVLIGAAIAAIGAALYVANDKWGIFDTQAQIHARNVEAAAKGVATAFREDVGVGLTQASSGMDGLVASWQRAQAQLEAAKTTIKSTTTTVLDGAGGMRVFSDRANQAFTDVLTFARGLKEAGLSTAQIISALGPAWDQMSTAQQNSFSKTLGFSSATTLGLVLNAQKAKEAQDKFTESIRATATASEDAAAAISADLLKNIASNVTYADELKKVGASTALAWGPEFRGKVADSLKVFEDLNKQEQDLQQYKDDPAKYAAGQKLITEEVGKTNDGIHATVQALKDAGKSKTEIDAIFAQGFADSFASPEAVSKGKAAVERAEKEIFSTQDRFKIDLGVTVNDADLKAGTDAAQLDLEGVTQAAQDAENAISELFNKNPAAAAAQLKVDIDKVKIAKLEADGASEKEVKDAETVLATDQKVVTVYQTLGAAITDITKKLGDNSITWDDVNKALDASGLSLAEFDKLVPGLTDHMNASVAADRAKAAQTSDLAAVFDSKAVPAVRQFFGELEKGVPVGEAFNNVNISSKGALNDALPVMDKYRGTLEQTFGVQGNNQASAEAMFSTYRDGTATLGRLHDGTLVVLDGLQQTNGTVMVMGQVFDAAGPKVSGLANNLGTLDEIAAAAVPKAKGVHQAFDDAGNAADGATGKVDKLGKSLSTDVTQGAADAQKAVEPLPESFQKAGDTAGKGLGEGLATAIAGAVGSVVGAIQNMTALTVTALFAGLRESSPSQYGIEAGQGIGDGVVSGIARSTLSVLMAIVAMGSAAASALASVGTELFNSAFNAGIQAGAGLAAGITSSTGQAQAAAATLATVVDQVVALKLQISSPSRVMIAHGVNVVKGLIVGIAQASPELAYATANLIQNAIVGPAIRANDGLQGALQAAAEGTAQEASAAVVGYMNDGLTLAANLASAQAALAALTEQSAQSSAAATEQAWHDAETKFGVDSQEAHDAYIKYQTEEAQAAVTAAKAALDAWTKADDAIYQQLRNSYQARLGIWNRQKAQEDINDDGRVKKNETVNTQMLSDDRATFNQRQGDAQTALNGMNAAQDAYNAAVTAADNGRVAGIDENAQHVLDQDVKDKGILLQNATDYYNAEVGLFRDSRTQMNADQATFEQQNSTFAQQHIANATAQYAIEDRLLALRKQLADPKLTAAQRAAIQAEIDQLPGLDAQIRGLNITIAQMWAEFNKTGDPLILNTIDTLTGKVRTLTLAEGALADAVQTASTALNGEEQAAYNAAHGIVGVFDGVTLTAKELAKQQADALDKAGKAADATAAKISGSAKGIILNLAEVMAGFEDVVTVALSRTASITGVAAAMVMTMIQAANAADQAAFDKAHPGMSRQGGGDTTFIAPPVTNTSSITNTAITNSAPVVSAITAVNDTLGKIADSTAAIAANTAPTLSPWDGLFNLGQGTFDQAMLQLQQLILLGDPAAQAFNGNTQAGRLSPNDLGAGGNLGGKSMHVSMNVTVNAAVLTPADAALLAEQIGPALKAQLYSAASSPF